MNRPHLLRMMIFKELRMLFRERHQVIGLVIAIIAMALNMIFVSWNLRQELLKRKHAVAVLDPSAATQPGTTPYTSVEAAAHAAMLADHGAATAPASRPDEGPDFVITRAQADATTRWVIVGVVAFLSVFVATVFTTPMAISTFVGEREHGTMELLLASPVPDGSIFWLKCLAVLIPTAALVYAFIGLVAAIAALIFQDVFELLPPGPVLSGLLMGAPLPLLFAATLTGAGACASIRAQTTKGANQTIGVVFLIVTVGGALTGFAGPRILRLLGMRGPFLWWLGQPLVVQYFAALLLPVALTATFFLVARWLFDREKMLM